MAGGIGKQQIEASRPQRLGLGETTDRLEHQDFDDRVLACGRTAGSFERSIKGAHTGCNLALDDEFEDALGAFFREGGEFHKPALDHGKLCDTFAGPKQHLAALPRAPHQATPQGSRLRQGLADAHLQDLDQVETGIVDRLHLTKDKAAGGPFP